MFHRFRARLEAMMDLIDEALAFDEDAPAPAAPHPHTRAVSLRTQRRPGTVAPTPAHCLAPVRSAGSRTSTPQGVR